MDNSLTSLLGSGSQSSQSNQIIAGLQSQTQLLLVLGTILSILVTILFAASLIHKWRVQSAIIRIDKNLKKLVDYQVPTDEKEKVIVKDETPELKSELGSESDAEQPQDTPENIDEQK